MAVELFDYQRDAVNFLHTHNGRAALLMKMRTGKTRAAVVFLSEADAQRIVVVCPKSVAYVWRDEIRIAHPTAKVAILVDLGEKRAVEKIKLASKYKDGPVFLIVNWESYWRSPAEDKMVSIKGPDGKVMRDARGKIRKRRKAFPIRGIRKALIDYAPDTLIWDEAQRLKRRSTKQSQFANKLETQPSVDYAIPLTGTAITEGVQDLFGIWRAFNKDIFGTNYKEFERRYIELGGFHGYEIMGYRNVEEIDRKVDSTAFQYEGPPDDIEDIVVPVALTAKTRRLYDRMRKDAIAEIEGVDANGEPLRGTALARIVLTSILRLQQMTGGFVTTDKGPIAIGSEKLDATVELATDALENNRRVVVFCHFLNEIDRVSNALSKAKITDKKTRKQRAVNVGLIYGDVSATDREREIEALRSGKRDVLVVQIVTGSLGIDLSGASVEIFYSMGYSFADFLQARARLLGPKQTSSVTSYILQAQNSIDEKVFKALSEKQKIAQRVTKLQYAKGLLG